MDPQEPSTSQGNLIKVEELIINDEEEVYEFDVTDYEYQDQQDPQKCENDAEDIEDVTRDDEESVLELPGSPLLDIDADCFISKYMIEIGEVLNNHEVITLPNSLALNQYMKKYLLELREKIVLMIEKCRLQYKRNSKFLQNQCQPVKYKCSSPYYGAPFFKNLNFHPCYGHPDYIHRREVLKEFFPINCQNYKSCVWTLKDKVDLLQGIKAQIIMYMNGIKNISKDPNEYRLKIYKEQIKTLYDQVKDDEKFQIDFAMLSFESLRGRHDAYSCAGMWRMNMRPDINRADFTDAENRTISMAVNEYNCQDWYAIADLLENRTPLQCITQYWTVTVFKRYDSLETSFKWTKDKDELLIDLVKKYTIGESIQWVKIHPYFPNLERSRIVARYLYSIKPGLIKGKFDFCINFVCDSLQFR